jgi:hypothetical protein
MLGRELLKRPHRHVGEQGDRLDTLGIQIRELAAHIGRQMTPRVAPINAIGKPRQVRSKPFVQPLQISDIYVLAFLSDVSSEPLFSSIGKSTTRLASAVVLIVWQKKSLPSVRDRLRQTFSHDADSSPNCCGCLDLYALYVARVAF